MSKTKQSSVKVCSGCYLQINDERAIACKQENCNKIFHAEVCGNALSLTPEQNKTWACPDCQAAAKTGGDNSHTPVRTFMPSDITLRKKKDPAGQSEISELTSEIRQLRNDVLEINFKLTEAITSISNCTARLDSVFTRIQQSEDRLQALEDKQNENIVLKETVFQLQDQLNKQAQASLRNELEIVGCPENSNENPHHIVLATAVKIGLKLNDNDLDGVWRAGPRVPESDSCSSDRKSKPRVIAVKFTRRSTRDDFLKAARTRRNLTTADILPAGNSQKIYVNERLTRTNRLLFRAARQRASESNFKHCWTSNGSVFVRKRDGASAIRIGSSEDIDRFLSAGLEQVAAAMDSFSERN